MANWDRLKRDALFEMLKFKKRISLKIFFSLRRYYVSYATRRFVTRNSRSAKS